MIRFHRNPSIPVLNKHEILFNTPIPGYLHCVMERVLGWGRGAWEIQVVIDLKKREYNTNVRISYPERHGLSKTGEEILEAEGIELTEKELRTIIRLFKSKGYRHFLANNYPEMWEDAGWIRLRISDTDDMVTLHSEQFDFYKRDKLPRNRFQRGAWWWSRGLRHIYKRMRDVA